jgi:hypothetical protein
MQSKKSFTVTASLSLLALASVFAPYAHAGCGMYTPVQVENMYQSTIDLQQFEASALALDDDATETSKAADPSIVGTWKEHWISIGSKGIPDGTEVDAGYAQWHSDGTEDNLSGLRTPMTGNVCFGEWIKTGVRTYRMNHFGISYDPTGQKLVGPARIQQWLTIGPKGQVTAGRFTIDQYNEDGVLLAHVQGAIVGTRVTMDTGFQKVE